MMLYLLRHAKAIPRHANLADESRYLTAEGRDAFHRTFERLATLGLAPDLILTSPLLRSVQTAEILACVLDYQGPLLVDPRLAPGFGRRQLGQLLKEHETTEALVLVGHEPDLSLLVTALLGIKAHFTLKKGDLVAIELDAAGKPSFRWRTFRGQPTDALHDRKG